MKKIFKTISVLALMMLCFSASAGEVTITKPYFRWLFGGFGFQHPEANFEATMNDEFRYQRTLKTFAEISPSFARVYAAYANSSKDQLDRFAQYYHETFGKAGTIVYLVPCPMACRADTPDVINAKEYARRLGDNLEYLIKDKGCRSISYFCVTNELTAFGQWGWFMHGKDINERMQIYKDWTIACYDEFTRRGLDIRHIGSDVATGAPEPSDILPYQEWTRKNMDDWLDAYVSHWYVYGRPVDDLTLWSKYKTFFNKEVQDALALGKHYILGEFGFSPVYGKNVTMVDDAGHAIRQIETAGEGVLCKCEVGLAAMNAGAYGAISWSFADYPDPFCAEDGVNEMDHIRHEASQCAYHPDIKYNKWGLFHWSDVDRNYAGKPELYALGYLAKLFKKNSTVLTCESSDSLVRTGAVLNPDRTFSVALINRSKAQEMTIDCSSWAEQNGLNSLEKEARVYVYEADNPPYNEFNDLQDYSAKVKAVDGKLRVQLPARSMVFVTTDYVDRTPSKITGVKLNGNRLEWKASADPEHRYYRVFKDGKQIASTVATFLTLKESSGKYTVVSVDAWGNHGE